MKHLLALSLILALLISCQSTETNMIQKTVDAPAVYYSLVRADSVLYSYANGYRSVDGQQPIDEQAQFALFSITKTFTAMAVLHLQEKGQLQIDDPASKYLPQYSFLGDITIRHLLSHQSGLNNPMPVAWVHLAEENADFDYQAFSTETLKTEAKAKRKPGRKAAYSNLNYLLLGEIIEAVSSQPYQQFMRKAILGDNKNIGFKWSSEHAVTGYHDSGISGWILGWLLAKKKYTEPKDGKLIPFKRLYLNGPAYGGLMATPAGLNQFLQHLLSPKDSILSRQTMDQMFTEQPLANGKPSGFSLGWHTGNLDGNRYLHHAGGGGGFYLELRVYPEKGIATYVLTNKSGFSDERLLDKLDQEYVDWD